MTRLTPFRFECQTMCKRKLDLVRMEGKTYIHTRQPFEHRKYRLRSQFQVLDFGQFARATRPVHHHLEPVLGATAKVSPNIPEYSGFPQTLTNSNLRLCKSSLVTGETDVQSRSQFSAAAAGDAANSSHSQNWEICETSDVAPIDTII